MRAALLCLVAACGDNVLRPDYDSTFDHDELTVFGDLEVLDPDLSLAPVPATEVCLEQACRNTLFDGTFVIRTATQSPETTVEFPQLDIPVIVPVVAGTLPERNLAFTIVLSPAMVSTFASGFGVDPALDRAGMVLVIAQHDSTDPISFAIDGFTTSYFDDASVADPTRTTIGARGSAAWFAVPPGEVTIRTTAGACSRQEDGWAGDGPGEIRAPVVVGSLTLVRPLCH